MATRRADDLFPETLPPHVHLEPPAPPRLTLRSPSWAVYLQLKAHAINAVKPMNQVMWEALTEYWATRGLLTGEALENHPDSIKRVMERLAGSAPAEYPAGPEPVQMDLFENCS